MGGYLEQYGEGDERRGRTVKRIVLMCLAVLIVAGVVYFVHHNHAEKQAAKHFLALVNAGRYQEAYEFWGCTKVHPCPNYDYQRFMEDWGPSKNVSSPWKIASVDGCRDFVTVNVQARGSDLESLMVERDTHILGFAPAPECQEKEWHFKQFFHRIFGG